jgi:accessory gene regulator protein AgrB
MLLLIILALIPSVVATAIVVAVVSEGVKDELKYPIANCDVNLYEEMINEEEPK